MKYNLIVAQMIRPNAIELFSKLLSKNTHVFCDGNIPIGIADLFVCFGVSVGIQLTTDLLAWLNPG